MSGSEGGGPVQVAGAGSNTGDSQSRKVNLLGGVPAVLLSALLLASLLSFFVALPGLGLRNWLIVLFELNAGVAGLAPDPLRVLNPLDFAVLVLAGITFLGLRPALHNDRRIWTAIGVALPFLGIGVLLITNQAGRSGLMGGGLVIAFLMLRNRFKALAYLGIFANVLLLAGDFATGGSPAPVVAGVVALGYMMLIAWFLLIGAGMLRSALSGTLSRGCQNA